MENQVYKGQIVQVTEEKIDGITWERVYVPDGVIVFPITNEGKILLVEEKRPHENPPVRVKAVSGILEHDKGTPEENAQREMQEEIGFKSNRLEKLMTLKGSGTINSEQHFFIAWDLEHSKLPNPDGEDTIMGLKAFTPEELKTAIFQEDLRWSMSTLGLLRLLRHLGHLS